MRCDYWGRGGEEIKAPVSCVQLSIVPGVGSSSSLVLWGDNGQCGAGLQGRGYEAGGRRGYNKMVQMLQCGISAGLIRGLISKTCILCFVFSE